MMMMMMVMMIDNDVNMIGAVFEDPECEDVCECVERVTKMVTVQ